MFSTLYGTHSVQDNTEIQTGYYSASAPLLCVGQKALSWQHGKAPLVVWIQPSLFSTPMSLQANTLPVGDFFLVKGFRS